jgi:hypothetical protein
MLPREMSFTLLRALDRWKKLWDAAFSQVPLDQRRWLGISGHAPELAMLSRLIIETCGTERAKTLRYLQGIAGSDLTEFHHFLKQNRPANAHEPCMDTTPIGID